LAVKKRKGFTCQAFIIWCRKVRPSPITLYAMGRNMMIDNAEMTQAMAQGARQAFEEEDEPMIRECQALMGTTDLMSLRPAILQTDIAGVHARRTLSKLIKAQS
jgi:Vanillate O-demethylase oxygenase C-terminal domain